MKEINLILNKYKGRVCSEFEKICPTDISLKRAIKEMHNIFDDIERDISTTMKSERVGSNG